MGTGSFCLQKYKYGQLVQLANGIIKTLYPCHMAIVERDVQVCPCRHNAMGDLRDNYPPSPFYRKGNKTAWLWPVKT